MDKKSGEIEQIVFKNGTKIERMIPEKEFIFEKKADSDVKTKVKGKKATLEDKVDYLIELLGGDI